MPTEAEAAAAKAAADQATADKTAADKAAADKATADKSAADKAAADKAAADKATADKAAADKAAADKATADAAAGKSKAGEASTEGAPDKYALTIPKDGAVDASDIALIEALAREHNLPNDQAQALLEQHNTMLIEGSTKLAAELTADRDYGGEKLAETQRLSKAVIDLVRPEGHPRRAAFQRLLDKSGYGNHIEIASFLADLGKRMKEDFPVGGGAGGGDNKDKPLANRLYPNQK